MHYTCTVVSSVHVYNKIILLPLPLLHSWYVAAQEAEHVVRKGDHIQSLVIPPVPYMYMYMYVSTVHVHPYMGSANFITYFMLKLH